MTTTVQLPIIPRTADAGTTQDRDAVVLPLRPVAELVASAGPVVIMAGTAASQRSAA